jgi:predicted O-methyltransferase YrrM
LREKEQLELLESTFAQYREEFEAFPEQPTGRSSDFFLDNPAFRYVDAHALHCMVRHHKPRRVIEVGSGYSTLVTAAACVRNQELDGVECTFVAIEPYPNDLFREEVPGLTRLIEERLEAVGCEIFEELDDGDILFIDSTHVLTTGSDVAQLYLEILPALKPGVLVHIHDIFLPNEYPKNWITEEHIFWNEQYLLQAFLAFNDSFEVVLAASFLHREYPDALAAAVPGFSPELHMPGSFWIRRIR